MERTRILEGRIRWLTWVFIAGLMLSGATAIPLEWEMDRLASWTGAGQASGPQTELQRWILKVREGVKETNRNYPFMAYGTDWLAFGHFVIAIAFVGALRDPVRNIWLFQFGMIACVLVLPYAMVFGAAREIPLSWRLIDCSFGVLGFIPLWFCHVWAQELEARRK
jgi:hypothetical protein